MKILVVLSILIGSTASLFAQNKSGDNQHLINRLTLSPAYAGAGLGYESYLSYNKRLLGVKEAPENKYLCFSAPLPKNIGAAIVVEQYSEGIYYNTELSADIAYHLQLAKDHNISFAIGTGFINDKLDFSSLSDESRKDPLIQGESSLVTNRLKVSAGAVYSYKTMNVGITVPNVLKNEMKNGDGSVIYTQTNVYRAFASNIFTLHSLWKLETHAIGELQSDNGFDWKAGGNIKYRSKYWLTAGARSGASFVGGLGALLHANVVMQYMYEYSNSVVASNGAHQIVIGFLVGKSKSERSIYSVFNTGQKQPYTDWVE